MPVEREVMVIPKIIHAEIEIMIVVGLSMMKSFDDDHSAFHHFIISQFSSLISLRDS